MNLYPHFPKKTAFNVTKNTCNKNIKKELKKINNDKISRFLHFVSLKKRNQL